MLKKLVFFGIIFIYILELKAQKCLNKDFQVRENPTTEISTRNISNLQVVVHILYNVENQNISDDQIQKQIESLNKDFRLENERLASTPTVFKALAANVDIQFCLASSDPEGQPSNGITRTQTNVKEIGLTESYYKFNQGGKMAWDPSKYINIWVADMGNSGILGFSSMPGDGGIIDKDGIVINYRFFGVDGPHQTLPHNLGATLTHEMGHYFGLPHIWGSLDTNCDDDDGFSDTPLQNQPTFDCPSFPKPDICTQGNGIMFMNFMDYTDDICQSMFTVQQKSKMLNTLNNERKSLLENSVSECTVSTFENKKIQNIKIIPNPNQGSFWVEAENSQNGDYFIFDLSGKLIYSGLIVESKSRIEIAGLENGMYIFKLGQKLEKFVVVY